MGQGFASVRDAAAEVQARRESGGNFVRRFSVGDQQSAVVRFLEQGDDVNWAWVCKLEPRPGRRFGDYEVTRDQEGKGTVPCPLAERGIPRQFRGWINVIWRDAPVFKRDDNDRLVRDQNNKPIVAGTADTVAVWETGITVFQELEQLDATFKGLASRDFRISRKGIGFDTRYHILPADPDGGPKPLSDADKALAAEKYDLKQFTTPKSYEELARLLNQTVASDNSQRAGDSEFNPFLQEGTN